MTFVRFENAQDTLDRSYGSITGLTMLDFTKRATRIIRFAAAKTSTSSEDLAFTILGDARKNYHCYCCINYININFFKIIFC